jgi:hypothetical protein
VPITKTQFYTAVEERVRDLMLQAHALLSQDTEVAYSEDELVAALGLPPDPDARAALRDALRALDGLGSLRWGLVGGREYYIYNGDLEDL